MSDAHIIRWLDSGKEPTCRPFPEWPNGKDLDGSFGAVTTCTVALPYPAKRIGRYEIKCRACGARIGCTTAGRPDDPKSIKIACAQREGQPS